MFLKLGTVFAHEEPSETTKHFEDGSSFTFACDRYVSERGVVAYRGRPALVVRTRCESAERHRAGTAVWLHGGPFTKFEEVPQAKQAALLSLGYELVTPLYLSSADRELDVRSDGEVASNMDDAIAEVVAVVKHAQQSGGRVILCGESYGALLAAAARHLRATDKLVLIGPILKSIEQLTRSAPKLLAAPLTFTGSDPHNLSMDEQEALTRKVFERFYGAWFDRNIVSILSARHPRDMLVIYGDKDEVIGLDLMPPLLALGGRSVVLHGSGHQAAPTRADIDRIIAELKR
ncbi:MAG: alpha/beta fold hydrolase [Allosphingosinicella sp.]